MIDFYSYIYLNDTNKKEELTTIIEALFPSYFLSWSENIGSFSVTNDEAFQLKLEKLHASAFIDANIQCAIVIVPYFNSLFIKYVKKAKHEVATIYDLFFRNSHLKETKNDANKILSSISKDNLDTIKAYIKCNGNANAAAEELFLHKNSYAYRIKKFTSDTNLDYNDLNTLMFIKLLISINN